MTDPEDASVEIRRSTRRKRTVSAYRDGDRSIVLVPAGLPRDEERRLVARLLARLDAQDARRAAPSDEWLRQRARELSRRHLGGRARPATVRWSSTQQRRWGSCTPSEGSIRISSRLADMPPWVLDYVLIHELVHLLHSDHGPQFWTEVARYPQAERARGFLEGVSHRTRAAESGPGRDGQELDGREVDGREVDGREVNGQELDEVDDGVTGGSGSVH